MHRSTEIPETAGTSVVVPVYNSTSTLGPLVARIRAAIGSTPHEIVLVDDGSRPATWTAITEVAAREDTVIGVRLGRNAGQQAALLAGVRVARFAVTVTLDDDLQNPPEEIPRLLAELEQGGHDLVYGFRRTQAGPRWRRVAGDVLRWALGRLTELDVRHLSPYRAFRTRLRDGANAVSGPGVVLDAILQWGTDRISYVEVEHRPRADGRSGYSFRQLIAFALDVVTGYATRPLRATTWLGFTSAAFGLMLLFYVLGQALLVGSPIAGFPFLASSIALFSGAQLVALGIIGEYLARMHVRILGQPTYAIAETVGGPEGVERSLE